MNSIKILNMVRLAVVSAVIFTLTSCVKPVEPVSVVTPCNIFMKRTALLVNIKNHPDTNTSKDMVSRQWDTDYMSGSGHSDLACD